MQIDDYEISERIVDKLVSIIDVIPDSDIISYAKINRIILKGYQLNKKNASIFRQRIKKSLPTVKSIDQELHKRLVRYSLNYEIVSFLSLPILEKQLNNMLTIYGYDQMIIGLLLDGRKEVRQLGINVSKNEETELLDEEIEKAESEFSDTLEPLLDKLSAMLDITESDDADLSSIDIPEYSEAIEKQQQQIIQLTAELKEAKEFEKKERKLSRTLKEKSEKLQRLESELKKEKSEHKQVVSELKKANKSLEKKENELASGINSGAQAELKLHIHDWLVKPTSVKKYVNDAAEDNKDLLHLAETVLKKQAQKDKHSGNLRTLREQLEKFINAQNGIMRARTEALNPLTELAEVDDKLKKKILDLQRIIGETEEGVLSSIASDIGIQINEASTIKEMDAIADKLIKIGELEIISGNELQRLYSAHHNKQERMYDLLLVDSPKAAIPTSLAWKFKYSIDKKEPFVWILDGHNVLFSLKDIFGFDPDSGVPGAAARNKLIDAMTALVKGAPQCEVNIFFDGPTYSQEHAATNVKITYSGGEGEHRADDAILEITEYMQQNSPDLTRVLVTDDRDLAKQAKKHKTASMRIAEFAAIVVDSK